MHKSRAVARRSLQLLLLFIIGVAFSNRSAKVEAAAGQISGSVPATGFALVVWGGGAGREDVRAAGGTRRLSERAGLPRAAGGARRGDAHGWQRGEHAAGHPCEGLACEQRGGLPEPGARPGVPDATLYIRLLLGRR